MGENIYAPGSCFEAILLTLRTTQDGLKCIANGTDCLGFTHDAAYFDGDEPFLSAQGARRVEVTPNGPHFQLHDDPGDFVVVIFNHDSNNYEGVTVD